MAPETEPSLSYRDALRAGLRDALTSRPDTILMGEDVGRYGGAFAVSRGLLEEFGSDRVMDMPLSEAGFTGMAIGAAIGGLRPIVEIMTVNFSLLALDQLFNQAALLSHMTAGQVQVPMVVRISCGIGRQLAAQHSHSWEVLFAHVPGLKVVAVGTAFDARQILQHALHEPGPVIILEYTSLLNMEGPVSTSVPYDGGAALRRSGDDLTLITFGTGVAKCLESCKILETNNLSADLIDLRWLRPMDTATIYNSVARTHRALVVEDGWRSFGIGAEVAAGISEHCFFDLDAPVRRLGGAEVPIPYPLHLEQVCFPDAAAIAAAARNLCGHD